MTGSSSTIRTRAPGATVAAGGSAVSGPPAGVTPRGSTRARQPSNAQNTSIGERRRSATARARRSISATTASSWLGSWWVSASRFTPAVHASSTTYSNVLCPQLFRHRYSSGVYRSEEHTSELQSLTNLVCRLLLEKKNKIKIARPPGAREHPADHAARQRMARRVPHTPPPHPCVRRRGSRRVDGLLGALDLTTRHT